MPKITNIRQLFDEPHEIWAIGLLAIGLVIAVAHALGYETVGPWGIVALIAMALFAAIGGAYKKFKAGPSGIDIERGD